MRALLLAAALTVTIVAPTSAQDARLAGFSDSELRRLAPQADGRVTSGPGRFEYFTPRQCWNRYYDLIGDNMTEMQTWQGRNFAVSNYDQPNRVAFNAACLSGAGVWIEVFEYSDGVPGWRSFLVTPKQ